MKTLKEICLDIVCQDINLCECEHLTTSLKKDIKMLTEDYLFLMDPTHEHSTAGSRETWIHGEVSFSINRTYNLSKWNCCVKDIMGYFYVIFSIQKNDLSLIPISMGNGVRESAITHLVPTVKSLTLYLKNDTHGLFSTYFERVKCKKMI